MDNENRLIAPFTEEDCPEAVRKYRGEVMKLRLLDDEFMRACFTDNKPAVQRVLRVILNQEDLTVVDLKVQADLPNLHGHSVRLDVLAQDGTGKSYNIEVQRASKGAGEKRARYHMAMIDAHLLKAGDDYEKLPEVYVIFITEEDFFGEGYALYRIERFNMDTQKPFCDMGHIIYANASYTGTDSVGKLMADFRANTSNEMHYPELAETVDRMKNTKEGISQMWKIMDDIAVKNMETGREKGIAEGRELTVKVYKRLMNGDSKEDIAQDLSVTMDFINHVAEDFGLS
jgi:predicted transposase/invertase (TIGR01784 family)